MQRRGVADGREPEEARLALLAQPLERRHHLAEHLPDAERCPAARLGDRVVEVDDVDPLELQARETGFERLGDGVGDAAEVAGGHPHLGADRHVGRFELLQDPAEVLFGFAVAVLHRGVEVVHAGGDRARDGALLVERIAAHHQPADRAAAEAQQRELHPGAPECSHFHRRSSARANRSRTIFDSSDDPLS